MQKFPCVPLSSGRLPGGEGGSASRALLQSAACRPCGPEQWRPRGRRPLSGRVHVLLFKVTAVLNHLSGDNGRARVGRWAWVGGPCPSRLMRPLNLSANVKSGADGDDVYRMAGRWPACAQHPGNGACGCEFHQHPVIPAFFPVAPPAPPLGLRASVVSGSPESAQAWPPKPPDLLQHCLPRLFLHT